MQVHHLASFIIAIIILLLLQVPHITQAAWKVPTHSNASSKALVRKNLTNYSTFPCTCQLGSAKSVLDEELDFKQILCAGSTYTDAGYTATYAIHLKAEI